MDKKDIMVAGANVIPLPDMREVEEAAALWVVRLDDEPSHDDVANFKEWLAQNDHHKEAFNRLSAQWGDLEVLGALRDLAASDDITEATKLENTGRSQKLTRRVLTGAMAASVALAAGFAATSLMVSTQGEDFASAHRTGIGEQKTIDLPDGSKIILNTSSSFAVNYNSEKRHIRLLDGEAFFEVASNKQRPFVVETAKGTVTAIGTAFSVRIQPERVGVIVTEGRVALDTAPIVADVTRAETEMAPEKVEVAAGQSASLTQSADDIVPVETDVIERQLDWRDGILAFSGEPLEQVVSEISRYTDLTIEIEGEELRNQPIGGYFKIGETEALFNALQIMTNVEVEYIDDDRVRFYRVQ